MAAKILIVGKREGDASLVELDALPPNAEIVAHGETLEQILAAEETALASVNVLLNNTGEAELLQQLIPKLPSLQYVHNRWVGVDNMLCPALVDSDIVLTNSKGLFSDSLAEFCIGACLYFAKDFPRLMRQKAEKRWQTFIVEELKGATMGVIGYGSIGRQCAVLGKALGMRILAQRRRPDASSDDPIPDAVFSQAELTELISQSDYIVVAAPLTPETKHMVGARELAAAKPGAVFVNVGRGAVVDEEALIEALQTKLKGAALDVFTVEPLPSDSPLWTMENVIVSPHTADVTRGFINRSMKLFVENVPKFIDGQSLMNVVDKQLGY